MPQPAPKGRKKLILVVSDKMGRNKKPERNEHGLVRMAATTRKNMGFDKTVSVSSSQKSMVLDIFQAFTADVKAAKDTGEYTTEECQRIGFVTKDTYDSIIGGKHIKNVWISDTLEDPIVMGADPEFLLFRPGNDQIVHANGVMLKNGPIGCDGAMAEVRPDPATTPAGLVDNIRKIFANNTLTKSISDLMWMAACYYKNQNRDYPVGGHIHIGNPSKIMGMPAGRRDLFFAMLNKAMDELLSIPMVRLDGNESGSCRRTKCGMVLGGGQGYGYFGEWRKCDGRLEHRTLSGMWLMHPSIAKAVFGTARAIIGEAHRHIDSNNYNSDYICPGGDFADFGDSRSNGGKQRKAWQNGFDGWKSIPLLQEMGCVRSSNEMNRLLNTCAATSINTTYLKKWFSTLRNFSTFKDNEECIRALMEILSVPVKEIQAFDKQLQNNWLEKNKFIVDF